MFLMISDLLMFPQKNNFFFSLLEEFVLCLYELINMKNLKAIYIFIKDLSLNANVYFFTKRYIFLETAKEI